MKLKNTPIYFIILGGVFLLLFGIGTLFSASTYESFSTTLSLIDKGIATAGITPLLASIFLSLTISSILLIITKVILSSYPIFSNKKKWTILAILGVFLSIILFLTTKNIITDSLVYPSNYFYFWRQIVNIGIAFIIGGFVYLIPIKTLKSHKIIYGIIIFMFLLQLGVFLPEPIGVSLNGAKGWINIGFRTIQPAEFFKLGYVIFLASWLMRKKKRINDTSFITHFVIINAFMFGLFLLIPDIGTVIVMALTGLVMARYSGAKLKYMSVLLFGGIFMGVLSIIFLTSITDKYNYITDRFTAFISSDTDDVKRGVGWQNYQALIAIGGGGISGQGYGKGLQKFRNLPEAQSDFIFAAISEEIGFIGNLILLSLYIFLGYSFISNIKKSNKKNDQIKIIGIGVLSLILVQAFVNIGVNIKILPNTGLTLPFISYGGTAIIVNVVEVVLLYKIAIFVNKK